MIRQKIEALGRPERRREQRAATRLPLIVNQGWHASSNRGRHGDHAEDETGGRDQNRKRPFLLRAARLREH
jgi:hypothetical protein